MNITLTGNLGSGKSSICKIFKEQGFGIVSGGDLFRGVAKEKGLTVIEMNELAKKDRTIDDLIDSRSTRLGDELDHTVFDSRLAWHFVRESFKVFLLVDTDEAARRVFTGAGRDSEEYGSLEETADGLSERAHLEMDRFKDLYNIDYYELSNYDLVIESTNATPEQIAEEILRVFEIYQSEKYTETRVELNVKNMYPGVPVTAECTDRQDAGAADAQISDGQISDPAEPAKNLCMDSKVSVLSIEGYNFIEKDQEAVMKALHAGKIFAEIGSFRKAEGKPALTEEDYRKVEEIGDFCYRVYPTDPLRKHEYMMDLTK